MTAAAELSRTWQRVADTCDAHIAHATQDNTRSYLALLPPDLRAVVDRLARGLPWLHSGVLTPIELPEPLLLWHHVHPAVSADGEQLIVIGLRPLSPQDLAKPVRN